MSHQGTFAATDYSSASANGNDPNNSVNAMSNSALFGMFAGQMGASANLPPQN